MMKGYNSFLWVVLCSLLLTGCGLAVNSDDHMQLLAEGLYGTEEDTDGKMLNQEDLEPIEFGEKESETSVSGRIEEKFQNVGKEMQQRNEAKQDKTQRDEIQWGVTKQDGIRWNETQQDETQQDETNWDEIQSEKTETTKSGQRKQEGIKQEGINQEGINQKEMSQEKTTQTERKESVEKNVDASEDEECADEGAKTEEGMPEVPEAEQDIAREEQARCGHEFQKTYWPSAPTCTCHGSYVISCVKCGLIQETGTDPALPHTEVFRELKHGNCVQETVLEYYCSVCERILRQETYVNEEHDWVRGIRTTKYWDDELGMVEEAYEVTQCSRCKRYLES